jgi:hypothetical protein
VLENANRRSAPSTAASILTVVPKDSTVEALQGTPEDGFYKASFGAAAGWVHSAH